LLAVAGFGRHVLAGTARQQQARVGVAAQESGGGAVVDVQALEQGVGGVAAAGAFSAEQLEAEIGQRFGLGLRGQRLHRFEHLAHRQVGGVGCHGCYTEGRDAGAQQQDCEAGGDPFGMAAKAVGDREQYLGRVWQLQDKIPTKMHRALREHRTAV